jgi:hypothetical protein
MDLFSLFFSCLMLGKARWILFWPPDICNIKVVSKVHNVYFFSSSCQSKQSHDVYFSCVTLKNLIIKCGTSRNLIGRKSRLYSNVLMTSFHKLKDKHLQWELWPWLTLWNWQFILSSKALSWHKIKHN